MKKSQQATNRLRDLDVALLRQQQDLLYCPPLLRKALEGYFQQVQKLRNEELKNVQDWLQSAGYLKSMQKWQDVLTSPALNTGEGQNSQKPVALFVRKRLDKRYQKLAKAGQEAQKSMTESGLHALRIEGKKMRYLLEIFHVFFPVKACTLFLKLLKSLQNNLGDYHDFALQQQEMIAFIKNPQNRDDQELALAVGSLVGQLYQKQLNTLESFSDVFASFYHPENKNRFASMIQSRP